MYVDSGDSHTPVDLWLTVLMCTLQEGQRAPGQRGTDGPTGTQGHHTHVEGDQSPEGETDVQQHHRQTTGQKVSKSRITDIFLTSMFFDGKFNFKKNETCCMK